MRISMDIKLKKKNVKWGLKGSFTLEAALLMPLILACIIVIMYLSFYIHNQAALYSIAYEGALKASQLNADERSEIYSIIDGLLENKLLGAGTINKQVKIDGKSIKVFLSGSMSVPGFEIMNLLMPYGGLSIFGESEIQTKDTVALIRNYRLVDKLKTIIEE